MNLVHRYVTVSISLFSALLVAVFSTAAAAYIPTCSELGHTTFVATHPQATDPITFIVTVFRVVPDGDLVLTNITYGPGNDIMMDVVAVPPDATSLFPGYQTDPVTGATIATGTFGPLPVGQYAVTTTFRVYDPVTGFTSPCPGEMNSALIVYAGDGLSPVIEYYNSKLDHYFITQDPVEIAALDAGVFSGWVRTGQSFLAYLPHQGFGTPILRYYGLPSAGWIHTSTLSTPAKLRR